MGQQQNCFIHTAQSKTMASEPIEGVYIDLIGDYNSDRSDSRGIVKLFFPDKKNGDPFRIKSIQKDGYVLTDKHWLRHDASLSSKVRLDIAMKSESVIRRETTEWSHSITSATNERWYRKEKNLNDSLDMQRITIKEYEKEIEALKKAKESFGQMLSYMSEYCASIDFSKITANQEKVLNLLKDGDIESADIILNIDSISDDEIIANILQTREEIMSYRQKADSLSNAVSQSERVLREQIDAAKTNFCLKAQISYQKGDFNKAAYYYSKAADVEISDVDRQIEAACTYIVYEENFESFQKYLINAQNNIVTKEDEYKCLEIEYLYNLTHGKAVNAGLNVVSMLKLYFDPWDYIDYVIVEEVVAEETECPVETIVSDVKTDSIVDYVVEMVMTKDSNEVQDIEYNSIYRKLSAEIYDLENVDFQKISLSNFNDSISCSKAFSYLGITCQLVGKPKDAVKFLAASVILRPGDVYGETFGLQIFGFLDTFISNGFYNEALELCNLARIPQDKLDTKENQSWNSIIDLYATLCRSNTGKFNYNDSEIYQKGLDAYAELISPESLPFLILKSGIIKILIAEKAYSKGIETAEEILKQIELIVGKVPTLYDYLICNNKATCYYYMHEYDKALEIYMRLQGLLESGDAKNDFAGENNEVLQSLNFYNIAQNFVGLGENVKACPYHEKALALRKSLYGSSNSYWLYESYKSLIPIYAKLNKYDRANELADEYIFCSKVDTLQNWRANKMKYDILISQLKNQKESKQIKKEVEDYMKNKELAFMDTRTNAIYIFLDIDKYNGFPENIGDSHVLTPSNNVCVLKATDVKTGTSVIINSTSKDIKDHSRIYKQWKNKAQN